MAPVANPRLVFNQIPEGLPDAQTVIYDDTQTIDIDSGGLEGGILVKILAVSLDPYMRNRMRPIDTEGDMPAFALGQSITGFGIGVILRSESDMFEKGQHVYGFMPYQQYAIFATSSSTLSSMPALGLKVVSNPHGIPWRYYVGAVGMTGQTAYYGLKDICDPKPGEVFFVSAAAGAVGHLLVQLAKAKGLKVIASCGSDEKVALVKALGADHAFNYKKSNTAEELKKHGPIDIYFDNVGGPTLEAAIENAAQRARFVICGMVSQYNTEMDKGYGVRNLWLMNRYRIKMEGFIVIDWDAKYSEEFYDVMPRDLVSGRIKYLEHIYKGFEKGGQGLIDLMTGGNVGKAVVVLDDDE